MGLERSRHRPVWYCASDQYDSEEDGEGGDVGGSVDRSDEEEKRFGAMTIADETQSSDRSAQSTELSLDDRQSSTDW